MDQSPAAFFVDSWNHMGEVILAPGESRDTNPHRTAHMVETALLTLAAASGATLAGGITGAIYAVWDTVRKTKKPTKTPQNERSCHLRSTRESGNLSRGECNNAAGVFVGGYCGEELGSGWRCPFPVRSEHMEAAAMAGCSFWPNVWARVVAAPAKATCS